MSIQNRDFRPVTAFRDFPEPKVEHKIAPRIAALNRALKSDVKDIGYAIYPLGVVVTFRVGDSRMQGVFMSDKELDDVIDNRPNAWLDSRLRFEI